MRIKEQPDKRSQSTAVEESREHRGSAVGGIRRLSVVTGDAESATASAVRRRSWRAGGPRATLRKGRLWLVERVWARYPEIAMAIRLRVREQLSQAVLDGPGESGAGFEETMRAVVEFCMRCVVYGGVLPEGLPESALERVRLAARHGIPVEVMAARYAVSADVLWAYVIEEIEAGFEGEVRSNLLAEAALTGPALQRLVDREIAAAHASVTTPASPRVSKVKLTPREREVHQLLRQGLTNKDIAKALTISYTTVCSHITNMLEKTGVSSRHQLAELEFQTEPEEARVMRLSSVRAQFALSARPSRYQPGRLWGSRAAAPSRVALVVRRPA